MAANDNRDKLLWQYAGLATQLLVSLGLTLYVGDWVDKKWAIGFPLLAWVLPLLVLIATFIKLIKDTSKKK